MIERANLEGSILREVGGELRELRVRRGMSLRDVAVLGGGDLTPQGISRIERGERQPNSRTLVALAKAFEIALIVEGDGIRVEED